MKTIPLISKSIDDQADNDMQAVFSKHADIEQLLTSERPGMLGYACYRLGSMAEAEDAVQEVSIRFFQRLRDDNSLVRNPRSYLYRSLANHCTNLLREVRPLVPCPPGGLPEPAVIEDDDFEQELRRISRLLSEIPEEQAEVIRLRFYGNKSFKEISEILGLPLTTAKSRFLYGLEKIKRGVHVPSYV